VRWWFVAVTFPRIFDHSRHDGCRDSELERFESTTPMENQPTNVNPCNECDKWLVFPPDEGPHGESETNVGNFASTVQPTNDWEFIPEMESKWMAINGASE